MPEPGCITSLNINSLLVFYGIGTAFLMFSITSRLSISTLDEKKLIENANLGFFFNYFNIVGVIYVFSGLICLFASGFKAKSSIAVDGCFTNLDYTANILISYSFLFALTATFLLLFVYFKYIFSEIIRDMKNFHQFNLNFSEFEEDDE